MEWLYLIGLSVAIFCLGLIDWKYKLAFFDQRRRTIVTIIVVVAMFVVWDLLGIFLGIFFHAGSPYTLSLRLAPELPLEEIFFLTLLCYNALIIYRFTQKHQKKRLT